MCMFLFLCALLLSRSLCRVLASLPSSSPLPKVLSAFWSKFGFASPPPFLQRSVLRPVEKAIFSDLKDRLSHSPVSSSSFSACLVPSSRAWLLALPSPAFYLSNREFSLASRLRLGITPSDALPRFVVAQLGCWKILDISCPVRC